MDFDKDKHLNEKQLLMAMVDGNDLSAEARAHLEECPQCLERVKELEQELIALGNMAERVSPRQQKRVSLDAKPRHAGSWFWNLRTAAGATVMVVLTVTLLWWSPLSRTTPDVISEVTFQEPDQLMTDIDRLVDNPLPSIYMYISGESQQEPDNDSGKSVVPSAGNINNPATKGAVLC